LNVIYGLQGDVWYSFGGGAGSM